jgi:hypothetical protein
MRARVLWTVAALCGYAVIVLVSRQVTGLPGVTMAYAPWAYGAGYFALGVLLLGAVSRWWRAGSPALWRPFMLSLGSLAAALEIWSQPPGTVAGALLDRWMLALLALLAVALLARLLPNHITRSWLDIDRRLDDADP